MTSKVLALLLFYVWTAPVMADESKILIEMERQTRQKLSVAVTKFILVSDQEDPEGLGEESRKILENDLRLSEWFIPVNHAVFEDLERMEEKRHTIQFPSWQQVGAQWFIKSRYRNDLKEGLIHFTFRLYDASNEQFLLGKKYSAPPV